MSQEIFIKAKNSDYLHEIVQKKDWKALIELASARDAFSDLIFDFFQTDESKPVLKDMTEEQILTLIDTAPVCVSNNILNRMESLCDADSKFTDIAVKLMKGVFTHGGDLLLSSVVKCLPLNILRIIIDSRIPRTEFHFGSSLQEFIMHIISTMSQDSKSNFSYKNLKERDCVNGVYTYIQEEFSTFPLGRREVFKELINATRESFTYVENNNNLDYKLPFIHDMIIDPFLRLINRGLQNSVYDYKNDSEIINLLKSIFDDFYHSKYFLSCAQRPILQNNGNNGILIQSYILEDCKVISPNYYYKVFKAAVEGNKDNFIDQITRVFFNNCQIMHYIRALNDGIYDKLFNASIDMTVREIIERKRSDNFDICCTYLNYRFSNSFINSYLPKFDECLTFVKTVISKLFDKSKTLNVDVTAYPEICCYLLNTLNGNEIPLPIPRNPDIDTTFSIQRFNMHSHPVLELLEPDMRNNIVLGVIRHPTDTTKFSHIITSNNPTTLVNFICNLRSVQDIKLVLPESKRNTVDKYGFREGRSAGNPKESCKMNLVEIFLHTLKFWENNDKSLFKDGYACYYQFVRKILSESIVTKDVELKKHAINVYYRFCELVSLMKNAKYVNIRTQIASSTFLTPFAVIVGSEIEKDFVESFINKYIQPFNAQSYQSILSEVISHSHLEMNYNVDEEALDNEADSLFKTIRIDEQMAKATSLLLNCIKQNPVKNFKVYYTEGIAEDFFTSEKRILNNLKKKFEIMNPRILDVCNPLKTEYPLDMSYNNPSLYSVSLREPQYKISYLVFLELCRFIQDEFKDYSPKMFKSNLTKTCIRIQNLIKDLSNGNYDAFRFVFYLDPPTLDTMRDRYNSQSQIRLNVLYSKPYFHFLNELSHNENSIYNSESYEIIKNAHIAQFLNEEDYLQQKNKPPPKFNGFDISIQFRNHRNSDNIFNTKEYQESVKQFKLNVYQNTNSLHQELIRTIERSFNNSKLLDDKPFDDIFKVDTTTHRSRDLSESARTHYYRKNVHQCFVDIIDALNKSKADEFANEFDSVDRLSTFSQINGYGSSQASYTMLTELIDLLINDFVSNKPNLTKLYQNRIATFADVYRFICIVTQVASPNIGKLSNLEKLCGMNERTVAQKVTNRDHELFQYIFRNGNIEQILLCMNAPLFSINAQSFYSYLLGEAGLLHCKEIINSLINEVSNNGKQILDDFHVALASCVIHPRFVGFPAPQASLDYLKKITNRSIYAKRAACANAVYYAIMCHTAHEKIPLKDIIEIIESAHKKSPDEITAFFCLLISEIASLRKMKSLPALSDLMVDDARPNHFIINLGIRLNLPKEIGELYYNCIEKIILSGLKSKKSHIYELTVTVLNEINVGPEIHQIISPFIEKGLKEIQPSDDNEAFLTYATSFTMKNPEFKGCFDSYCEALSKIQKHSFAILKANTHLNKDSPYPEPFKKLENSYQTIINTIEKPFDIFKEENEMIPGSQFCRKLLPVLQKNRPAVACDVYLRLESYASLFGDPLVEDMVHLYKQDKKEESLSKFLAIVTHHDELTINLPQSIRSIYHHLNSAFTTKHSIELAKNLEDSEGKLPVSMQRAYKLAEMISPDVLAHMPDEKSIENEDELVEILSSLGIFCKKNEIIAYTTCTTSSIRNECYIMGASGGAAPAPMPNAHVMNLKMNRFGPVPPPPAAAPFFGAAAFASGAAAPVRFARMAKKMAAPQDVAVNQFDGGFTGGSNGATMNAMMDKMSVMSTCDQCKEECAVADDAIEDLCEEPECAVEEVCDGAAPPRLDDDDDADEAEPDNDAAIGGDGSNGDEGEAEGEGDNELNQEQINDAFDVFF